MRICWPLLMLLELQDHMLQTVWRLCSQFKGFKQQVSCNLRLYFTLLQDAQEFVLFMLNQLSKEQPLTTIPDKFRPFFPNRVGSAHASAAKGKAKKGRGRSGKDEKEANGDAHSESKAARPHDFIAQQFGGSLRNQVSCVSCDFIKPCAGYVQDVRARVENRF